LTPASSQSCKRPAEDHENTSTERPPNKLIRTDNTTFAFGQHVRYPASFGHPSIPSPNTSLAPLPQGRPIGKLLVPASRIAGLAATTPKFRMRHMPPAKSSGTHLHPPSTPSRSSTPSATQCLLNVGGRSSVMPARTRPSTPLDTVRAYSDMPHTPARPRELPRKSGHVAHNTTSDRRVSGILDPENRKYNFISWVDISARTKQTTYTLELTDNTSDHHHHIKAESNVESSRTPLDKIEDLIPGADPVSIISCAVELAYLYVYTRINPRLTTSCRLKSESQSKKWQNAHAHILWRLALMIFRRLRMTGPVCWSVLLWNSGTMYARSASFQMPCARSAAHSSSM
jgi:hypothetical protein